MDKLFLTQPIMASPNTLRRVISDMPEEETVEKIAVGGTRPSASKSPLMLTKPVLDFPAPGPSEQNAFSELGFARAANSSIQPEVTNSKMMRMAEAALEAKLDSYAPEKIQTLIEEIAPLRLANIFAENSQQLVHKAVDAFAPERVEDIVVKLTPLILENAITEAVDIRLAERMAEQMPNGLETTVANIVKEEMQGAFGYNVTRKIRELIHTELKKVFLEER